MSRADYLAANLYRRARGGIVQHEGFLEDALAAALEAPGAWSRVRASAGWVQVPDAVPHVGTQEVIELGRTDVVLRWEHAPRLVLELKAWDGLPPDAKLADYGADGDLVTVIAPHPTVYPSPILPMFTWARLRAIRWPDAPLPWRQLCHLIDATGVAVPRLEMTAIMGVIPTWSAYDLLEEWIRPAADAAAAELPGGHAVWTTREGKQKQRLSWDHRRYGMWIWPAASNDDHLGIFCGLYVGTERREVLVPGVPDLRLMMNVKHDGPVAEKLRQDTAFGPAASSWATSESGIVRQYDPGWWYLLDARQPLIALAAAEDQALAFRGWMVDRAREWAKAGLAASVVNAL